MWSMSTNGKYQSFNRRLDSWKEIAAFFKCDERTVRRWEKERGMPVHRAPGGAGGRVFAYSDELSAWLVAPANDEIAAPPEEGPAPLEPVFVGTRAQYTGSLAQSGTPATPETAPAAPVPATPASATATPAAAIPTPSARIPTTATAIPARAIAVPASKSRRRFYAWAAALLAAAGVAVWLAQPSDPRIIAVLPFANGGGGDSDYLSDGIAESLIDNLTHVPRLKVRPRGSVSGYKGQDIKALDVRKLGRDLGVSMLISGRVVAQGDDIAVHAELTDVRDDVEVWGQGYSGPKSDIVLLQQRIAGDIADKLRSELSSAQRAEIIRQGTQDPKAYQLFLKGRYAWNKRTPADLEAAIGYFTQATAADPDYALAYSGLADVYSVRPNYWGNPNEDFPKSNAAARRALQLDATLAHPHAVLGENQIKFEWDFAGGEAEFKKAFALDPNDATAHQWYADDLGTIGGREQEALAQINLAHELDPLSPIITRVIGSVLVSARRFDEAIAVCSKLARENPTFAVAHDCLKYAYWGKGLYPQVIEESKIYAKLNGGPRDAEYADALDQGFRSGGWAGALAKGVDSQLELRKTGYASPLTIARLYAGLGDAERAFQWLDIAYMEHDRLLIGLNTYYQLDPVRSDPRFAELVRKVGLPQAAPAP
jgi:TolB-like protein